MPRWLRVCAFLLLAAPLLGTGRGTLAGVRTTRSLFAGGRRRSADQPRRIDGRLCPPLRRHHDRPHAADHLAGRTAGRPSRCRWRPGPARTAIRAGRPTAGGSPTSRRPRAGPHNCSCAGWRAAKPCGSRACPTRRPASPGRRTAARSPIRCSCADEGTKLGAPPAKPEGAQWAEPLEIISSVTYRADGQGYLKPGYAHVFLVSADGGAPRQMSTGRSTTAAPRVVARRPHHLSSARNRSPDWEREPLESEVHALDVESGEIRALTSRKGPDLAPVVSSDGRLIAYTGFDDKGLSYENFLLYVMDRDGKNQRPLATGHSTGASMPRSGPPMVARSTSPTTIAARRRWRGSASMDP